MPKLCVIPGDGIGQEVVPAAVEVLQAVMADLEIVSAEAGWQTFLDQGVSVPEATLEAIRDCGAALFGAVQSPSHKVDGYRSAILTMRQALGLFANLRPVKALPVIAPQQGINMLVVRENTEGLYAGRERRSAGMAVAERVITEEASRRIARRALQTMQFEGRTRLTIVHKANVLPLTDGLFRDCVRAEAKSYPEIEVDELLVDVAALKMVGEPERFDTIVTTNLFGDILSDAAAHWCGGLGYAPSLNWGDGVAVAEPVHGSAPDIAGQGVANPIAAILSGALLARTLWQRADVATQIETAIKKMLSTHQAIPQSTNEITQAIIRSLGC